MDKPKTKAHLLHYAEQPPHKLQARLATQRIPSTPLPAHPPTSTRARPNRASGAHRAPRHVWLTGHSAAKAHTTRTNQSRTSAAPWASQTQEGCARRQSTREHTHGSQPDGMSRDAQILAGGLWPGSMATAAATDFKQPHAIRSVHTGGSHLRVSAGIEVLRRAAPPTRVLIREWVTAGGVGGRARYCGVRAGRGAWLTPSSSCLPSARSASSASEENGSSPAGASAPPAARDKAPAAVS
jgi:hypothetical protein